MSGGSAGHLGLALRLRGDRRPLAGKRRLRVEVAKAAWAAARKSRDDAQRVLEAQVKQQFVQVLIAQDALKLVQEVARTSAKILELTETRYRVGAVSEADVARVDTARLEADQAVDTAVQNLRQARVGLAFLLGVRGTITDFEAVGPQLLHYQAPQRYQGAKSAELLRVAIERRADLLAARLLRDRAEAAVRLARRQRFPDVALSLTYSQQGTGTSAVTPPSFIVGLSSPLPVLYQQQGEIQRAEADLRSQILLVEKTESAVASDVEAAYSGFVTAEQLVKRMEGGLLDRARQARDLVLIQFQKGAASLLEYLDAQRTYTSTHLEYRQDLIAYWTSLFKLEQAVGADLQ